MAYKKPESALVVLYDQHYRVLLLQRQDDPTFWQSVTGAKQNQYEIRSRWLHRYPPGTVHNTEHVFSLQINSDLPIVLTEHLQYEWVSKDEALARLWSPSNKEAVSLFVPSVP